ncbi:N-fatty-acyl-amino acid synthase/hydrolase PM20D1 isoform X2 [Protopterus annectens]|uniref:N-fatty-acyl-amino acid synthase/hydrolase PM20D1 isoform X2 n=1 Tax=Protopterus annectens TaxID=7888 RepID=UPI001CF9B41F|nr:N-fatty-acyl-amino acid synthase/hydrolase PM20D1 isoform X2 [Protopterus annectens]
MNQVVRAVYWGALAMTCLVAVLLVRTYTFDDGSHLFAGSWEPGVQIDVSFSDQERRVLLEEFKDAIRIPTVSFSQTKANTTALQEFGDYIRKAHLDVVPATDEDWDVPPFSGEEVNGFIYGRGTVDDKHCLMGILQALEYLLQRGYEPRRSFYIGIGHDEEIQGLVGAKNIASTLQARGVSLSFLLDEGMMIFEDVISGIKKPTALIGTSEKGYIALALSVKTKPGHSSFPPPVTCIGILAEAVSRLERTPLPSMFGRGAELGTFEHLATQFSFPLNVVMTNLWLFSSLVSRILERKPATNALIRTTTALTMFESGIKTNVLPPSAKAIVNLRVHPAQTVKEVLHLVQSIVADERVKVEIEDAYNPIPSSSYSTDAFGFQTVKKTIKDIFPDVLVAPGLFIGASDSKHFQNLTKDIYRFAPVLFKPEDLSRFHGLNERISITGYEDVVKFYIHLIQNADADKLPGLHKQSHEL